MVGNMVIDFKFKFSVLFFMFVVYIIKLNGFDIWLVVFDVWLIVNDV